MIFGIIGFTAGLILFSIAMFKFGSKSYVVKLDVDVKNIIDQSVKEFLENNAPKECNHKWEPFREYTVSSDGNSKGKIIVQMCKNCGELKETRISAQ